MELRHLRYFVAAAEAENITRAAQRLHLSQPALSRQIRDLEDELRFPLFERSAKSVHLSVPGRAFLIEARSILQRVDEAVTAARAIATGGSELHIGYAMTPTVRILPLAMRAFQAEPEPIRVRLHDLTTGEMLHGLRDGRLQMAFMVRTSPAILRGLHSEDLAQLSVRLAVAPEHPLAGRKSVHLNDLAQFPLIAFSRGEYPDYYEMLEAWFAAANLKPRLAEEHDSVSSLIAAVEAGNGAALVTDSMACVAGPRLRLKHLTPTPRPLVLAAVWPLGGLSPAAHRFLACTKSILRTTTTHSPAAGSRAKRPKKNARPPGGSALS